MKLPVELFPVLEITDQHGEIPETLGTKEKFWIEHNGQLALLKFGRKGTGEDWAEKLACELCEALGLPHAHYELARCRGRFCVVSPNLVAKGGRLVLGNELTNYQATIGEATRTYQQREHTVSRVLASLKVHTAERYQQAWHDFIGYLLLDAWIGNTDRHHENWGLVRNPGQAAVLAPTFDHASSMGRELTDETRIQRLQTRDPRFSVAAFAAKARSAIYGEPTDKKSLPTHQAFLHAARAQRDSGFYWLEALAKITDEQVCGIVERIDPMCMSTPSREFAMAVLAANRSALLSVLGARS